MTCNKHCMHEMKWYTYPLKNSEQSSVWHYRLAGGCIFVYSFWILEISALLSPPLEVGVNVTVQIKVQWMSDAKETFGKIHSNPFSHLLAKCNMKVTFARIKSAALHFVGLHGQLFIRSLKTNAILSLALWYIKIFLLLIKPI